MINDSGQRFVNESGFNESEPKGEGRFILSFYIDLD